MENNQQPRILNANSANFVRAQDPNETANQVERPMTLSAWTQTTSEDLITTNEKVYDLPDVAVHGPNINKVLLNKIRFLQESLRQHTELLTQIHVDSELNNPKPGTSSKFQIKKSNNSATPPKMEVAPMQVLSPPNSIINVVQGKTESNAAESVNYKIVAEYGNCTVGEPIEIKLANESQEEMDMNSSADSDRLQICLGPEGTGISSTCPEIPPPRPPTIMKRRMTMQPITCQENLNKNIRTSLDVYSTYIMNSNVAGVLNQTQAPIANAQRTIVAGVSNEPHPTVASALQSIVSGVLNQSKAQTATALRTTAIPSQNVSDIQPNQQQKLRNSLHQWKTPSQVSTDTLLAEDSNTTNEDEFYDVKLGPNNTTVPKSMHANINWNSSSIATRKLLIAVFGRQVLATHSMTGKPSPAFRDQPRPLKKMLDPLKIQDIIFAVTKRCGASEKEVRNAITTKCADENKMMKEQERRKANGTLNMKRERKVENTRLENLDNKENENRN